MDQSKIAGVEKLSYADRRSAVISARTAEVYRVKNQHNPVYFDPTKAIHATDEQAFEQIVSRFEYFMTHVSRNGEDNYGLLIHDNNLTESVKLTSLMKSFHKRGTLWTKIRHIIETPLFVDSSLTGMIQLADLCALALRRYFENGETDLLDRIKPRFERRRKKIVSVRHFSKDDCPCFLCAQ